MTFTFKVVGSHGELTVDLSGTIMHRKRALDGCESDGHHAIECEEYDQIVRFDPDTIDKEYVRRVGEADIITVGYWYIEVEDNTGDSVLRYEPPICEDHQSGDHDPDCPSPANLMGAVKNVLNVWDGGDVRRSGFGDSGDLLFWTGNSTALVKAMQRLNTAFEEARHDR